VPNQEEHIERIVNNRGLGTFLIVGHTANLRKNSKISAIWHHGGGCRRLDDNSMTRYVARRTLILERNALGLNILEALVSVWRRNGVVTGTEIACPTTTRVQIEAQLVTTLLDDAGAVEEDVD
jgi:hypothetical protein